MKKLTSQTGFTLTEILIVLASSAIIGTILVTIMVQGSGIFSDQNTQVNQNLSLNNVSSNISQSIQFGSGILGSYTAGAIQYTTSSNTIIAQIPSLNAQGGLIENKYDTVVITTDPNKTTVLRKYLYPDPQSSRVADNKVLVTNLSQIQFIYLNDNAVEVAPTTATRVDFIVKVAEKSGIGVQESSISGRINLKNI